MKNKLNRGRAANRPARRKVQKLPEIMIALLILLLVTAAGVYLYRGYEEAGAGTYRISLRQEGWQGWEGVDFSLQEDGSVQISRGEYYAPYYMFYPERKDSPRAVAVISARMNIESFTGQAYTLITAYTASGPAALIVSRSAGDRYRLGIVTDVNQQPQYFETAFREKTWHDLYLVLDEREGKIYGYVDGNREATLDWRGSLYPLQEIWTGAFWVGGSNSFGVPQNQLIAAVNVDDESAIIAGQSPGHYLQGKLRAEPWLWMIIALVTAACLVEGFLLVTRRRNRHHKSREFSGEE